MLIISSYDADVVVMYGRGLLDEAVQQKFIMDSAHAEEADSTQRGNSACAG